MNFLCLGSLNIDRIYQVPHFVLAGETLSSKTMQVNCGGKGLNQSIALSRAGARVFHAGMIGGDGDILIQVLAESGVDVQLVEKQDKISSGHAIIQVDAEGQNCILLYGGANHCIDKSYIDTVYGHFKPGDIVVLQNEITYVEYAIEQAAVAGLTVVLNPSPLTDTLAGSSALSKVHWFLLNEIEGEQLTGKNDGHEICRNLSKKYPNSNIVLTLGKEGCLFYDGRQYASHGIYDIPVIDTTGAGDTFTGFFMAAVSEGKSVEFALELASKASSLAVNTAGAASSIPFRADVERTKLTLY